MHEGVDLLPELYPRCFCRTNRRPLKIGVSNEFMSEHPEMKCSSKIVIAHIGRTGRFTVFGSPFTKVRRA